MHSEFYFSIVPRNTPSSRFGKTCREFFQELSANTSLCNFKQTIACCLDMTAVKFFGCLDQITGILYTGSLISRMHCERGSPISTVFMDTCAIAIFPSVLPPAASERLAKNCTGTPAFSQIALKIAILTASLVYF